jgi:hypothetical protein
MAVPSVMADLSVTANSNSPAGSESPISTDDFHRAIQAILRHTNAKGADIASATTTDIGAATGEFVDVTGTTTITGLGTIAAGIVRSVRFTGALTLTHNNTSLILPGAANITTTANDTAVFRSLGSGNWLCIAYKLASGGVLSPLFINALSTVTALSGDYVAIADASDSGNAKKALVSDIVTLATVVPQRYFSGATFSTAGSSATMSISAWYGADSTNARLFSTAALAKTTSAWVVGTAAGGKAQTGAVANATWYHFYAIYRPDTGVSDICFSTNAKATGLTAGDFVAGGGNVPDAYTQFRYLGSGLTDGSAQWVKFTQLGDYLYWTTPSAAANNATVSTTELLVATATPLGVPVIGIYSVHVGNNTSRALRLYGPDEDDLSVTVSNSTLNNSTSSTLTNTTKLVMTDTSSQVAWKADASTTGCYLQTLGYIRNVG